MIVHRWWTGPPADTNCPASTWAEVMPGCELIDWTDTTLPPDVPTAGEALPGYEVMHRSNLVRAHLLYAYGGVWADHDITPLEPFDPLIGSPFTASIVRGRPEGAVMGGPAGHPFFLDLIRVASWLGRGPGATFGDVLADAVTRHPTVRVLPPWTFFDRGSNGTKVRLPSGATRYATHAWATSSQRR